jgi:hypothetical protein
MSAKLRDRLVEIQRSVRTRPLFTMRLETKLLAVGATPTTTRRIGIVPGGTFDRRRPPLVLRFVLQIIFLSQFGTHQENFNERFER